MSRLITFVALLVTGLLIGSVANAESPFSRPLSKLALRLQGSSGQGGTGEVSTTQKVKDLLHKAKDKLTGIEVHGGYDLSVDSIKASSQSIPGDSTRRFVVVDVVLTNRGDEAPGKAMAMKIHLDRGSEFIAKLTATVPQIQPGKSQTVRFAESVSIQSLQGITVSTAFSPTGDLNPNNNSMDVLIVNP